MHKSGMHIYDISIQDEEEERRDCHYGMRVLFSYFV